MFRVCGCGTSGVARMHLPNTSVPVAFRPHIVHVEARAGGFAIFDSTGDLIESFEDERSAHEALDRIVAGRA